MKNLTKIRLINWYTFHDETIDINQNSLISGQNGSGKSTLLDAIQFVLTGGGIKFNKAADEDSKRTLETYVRCKVSTDNKECLRDKDVTSYIVLEFFDNITNRRDIIGSVIEIPFGSKLTKIFFKISNQDISDGMFFANSSLKTLSQFKRNNEVEIFETKSEIKSMIKAVLGLSSDKYFELMTKALAFKPITDLNDFVNSFLLTEKSLNLDKLNENINNFRELQELIECEEKKINELEKIEHDYEEYLMLEDIKKMYEWLRESSIIQKIDKELQTLLKERTKIENQERINQQLLNKDENELNILRKERENFEKSQNTNKDFDIYQTLQKDITKLNDHLKNIESKYETFFRNLKSELKVAEIVSNNKVKTISKEHHENSLTILKSYQLDIERKKEEIRDLQSEYLNRKNKTLDKVKDITNKLEHLKRNRLPYKQTVIDLQKAVKDGLSEKYNRIVEIRPLCEYLEIKDELWASSIEGYLNTQRFDLIIEPKYFDDALEIYENCKKEKNIHGVGLVNTNKLKEQAVTDNSLASLIKSSNIYAEYYAIQLLNNVMCCNNVSELKKYSKSITKTCMVYKNNVARQIDPNVYEDKFIGEKAKKEQLDKYQKQYTEYNLVIKDLENIINNIDKELKTLKETKVVDLLQSIEVLDEYDVTIKELNLKQESLNEIKETNLLFDIISKIEKLREEEFKKNSEIENIRNQNSYLKIKIESLDKEIIEKQTGKDLKEQSLPIFDNNWQEKIDLLKKDNENSFDEKAKENEKKAIKLTGLIEEKLKKFNIDYQYDEIPELSNIQKYIDYLYKMREQDIVRYKSDSLKFKESCQKSFREDFICNLREYIITAQNEIKELNKALKMQKFGREKYEFVYTRSNDPELAKYYDIIISGANYVMNNLFDEMLTLEQQEEMEDLFNKITASNSLESVKNIVAEYTDYRRYMAYDIKITNDEGDTYYFSRVAREKSGGEIQTPFYVIIASSFEQLLKSTRRTNSLGCVVLFDEAFNNMDETRIEAMMNFYNKLNIQLLIAVPPQRVATIAPYVETNLIIQKQKNTSKVISIRKQELDKWNDM